AGDEARGNRTVRSVFQGEEAVPERGLLLRHHSQGDRYPDLHVHRDLCPEPHRGLDCTLERDDLQPVQDRPSAPAVYRLCGAFVCAGEGSQVIRLLAHRFRKATFGWLFCLWRSCGGDLKRGWVWKAG